MINNGCNDMTESKFIQIWRDYLGILCCPDCIGKNTELNYYYDNNKEYLCCGNCNRRYNIINDIPILFASNCLPAIDVTKKAKDDNYSRSLNSDKEKMSSLDDWKYLSYQYYTRYKEFDKNLVNFDNKGIVLDIGCAGGSLASKFNNYIGLDISWKLVSFARSYLDKPFVLADAKNMPFKNKSISHFISRNLLEHTRDDQKIIREAARVCNSSGVFELPCSDGVSILIDPVNVIRHKVGLTPKPLFSYGFGHINMQSEGEWARRLMENHFDIIRKSSLGRGILYKIISLIEFILFSSGDNDDIPTKYLSKKYFRFLHPIYDLIYSIDPKTNKSWSKVFYVKPKRLEGSNRSESAAN